MNRKILLINPLEENLILADNPSFVDEERGFNPPLGILYIAAAIEKNTDWDIKFIDMNAENISYLQLEEEIKSFNPEIIGMTVLSFTIIDVLKVAEITKKLNKEIKILLGGIHPYIYPNETINLKNVDYICLGEGEESIVEFLKLYPEIDSVKGFVIKKKTGEIKNNGYRKMIADLDSLDFPARRLSKFQIYNSLIAKHNPITTMLTTRGCPFKCTYCVRPHFGKMCRFRSPENIISEIKECIELGIKEIFFYDDTFTIDKNRVMSFCELMISEGLEKYIRWDVRSRVDTVDKEVLLKMKKAGCDRIHFGIESANERVLKILKKNITIDKVKETFKIAKKTGISTFAYFMIGSPTETREEILNTINFAIKLKPDYTQITVTTPFPETEMYKDMLKNGDLKTDYWKEFALNPTKDFQSKYIEDNLSKEELFDMLKLFYKKFYFRPSFLFKELLEIRSFSEFKKKFKAGLKILF